MITSQNNRFSMGGYRSFLIAAALCGASAAFAALPSGYCDANLADFPRLAGETDDSPRFVRAISAVPNGVLCVPKGEYDIGSMILITNRCSLSMHPAARICRL